MVDFGLAKHLRPGETEKAFCGSLGYIAPEVYMKEPYAFEVDLFSFGVFMFKILSGKRPWPAGPPEETGRRTVNLEYRIVNDEWKGVSKNGRDFIRQLLVFKEERLTVEQALRHDWLGEDTATVLRHGQSYYRQGLNNQTPSDAVVNVRYLCVCVVDLISPFVIAKCIDGSLVESPFILSPVSFTYQLSAGRCYSHSRVTGWHPILD